MVHFIDNQSVLEFDRIEIDDAIVCLDNIRFNDDEPATGYVVSKTKFNIDMDDEGSKFHATFSSSGVIGNAVIGSINVRFMLGNGTLHDKMFYCWAMTMISKRQHGDISHIS